MTMFWVLLLFVSLGMLAYKRASLVVTSLSLLLYLFVLTAFSHFSAWSLVFYWLVFASILIPLNTPQIRRQYLVKPLLRYARHTVPSISDTEREAMEAGTVGWEGELFQGAPKWEELLDYAPPELTEEEQAFIDGPVNTLCEMLDDWQLTFKHVKIPDDILQFIKDQGFLGLIIPKEYGGKAFSAYAHACILLKLNSRSASVGAFVSVPNSLGPAELLIKYGTEEQKQHYLPRLAQGADIPCFALTAPFAGSDAGSLTDHGIVCKGRYQGKTIIGIKLNWNKRYITLAPIATLLGLAFKLYDPDHLLGEVEDYGITCALIPTQTDGVVTGRRHFPLNQVFPNGPTQGKDVFIPLDCVIGGQAMAGQGWRMLVECLSVGRSISLPSQAVAGCKVASLSAHLYAGIRKQFNLPIGMFEGVEDPLAQIAGFAYITGAMLDLTVAAIDRGEKPAIPGAIAKYHATEMSRKAINHAMDIHGGKGICLGPNNYLGRAYQGLPIAITVEGANILTRSMIIFGQGSVRCHPYVLEEMLAVQENNLDKFDDSVFGHIGYLISNLVRAFVLGLTNGYFVRVPNQVHKTKRYYQKFTRLSAMFSLVADVCMIILGGRLKRRESISARLGDQLSMLYMGSAVLKKFQDQGQPAEMLNIVRWSCDWLLFTAQQQLDGLLRNFPNRWIAGALRLLTMPLGKRLQPPSDYLQHKMSRLLLHNKQARDLLVEGIYNEEIASNPFAHMEKTLKEMHAELQVEKRVYNAQRDGKIKGYTHALLVQSALEAKVITPEEAKHLLATRESVAKVINVDDFDDAELSSTH